MFANKVGKLKNFFKFFRRSGTFSELNNVRYFTSDRKSMNQSQLHDNKIVWIDLEMTGLDVKTDQILEVSCLITDKDLNILSEGPSLAINHPKEVLENMNEWCLKQHNASGLVQKCLESKINLIDGENIILDYLKKHVLKGKVPLAGNTIYMDRLFLRTQMPRVDDYLHYRCICVSTVKELALRWNLQVLKRAPKKKLNHRSLDDIKESIAELQYYRTHFFKLES